MDCQKKIDEHVAFQILLTRNGVILKCDDVIAEHIDRDFEATKCLMQTMLETALKKRKHTKVKG